MSEEMKMDAERARVVDAMCMTWRHDFGLDKREHKLGSCGMTDEERDALRRQMCQLYDHHFAQARASLPVGVTDGWKLVPVNPTDHMMRVARGMSMQEEQTFGCEYRKLVAAAPTPTVKAEQVTTPEYVWVRLLQALAGDNGCSFSTSTDDYQEAKPALVELIAAGFFRSAADSLAGDIWMVASGEQGEVAARFASCSDAYAVLSGVLNRVFERPEEAPSLPAAGSDELEEAAGILRNMIDRIDVHGNYSKESTLLFLNQALSSIVAALPAQQSAQLVGGDSVSVLRELLKGVIALIEQYVPFPTAAGAELRALLSRNGNGGGV